MAKGYVPIFFDWLETTQDLAAEEKGNLIDAVIAYAAGLEYEHMLNGATRIAFRFLKGQVDRNAAISEVRSKAGSNKGTSNANKQEQNQTNGNKPEQTETSLPKEKDKEKDKDKNKEKELLFERFWKAYPRKVNKPGAKRAFDKLGVDEVLLQTMLTAIAKQKQTAQWQENGGQYIPHPATWLNGRRWEDDVCTGKKPIPAADFTQRDYDGVDAEMQADLAREIEEFKRGVG